MNKILTVKEAIKVSKNLKLSGKTVVVSGGCFDMLHIGHVKFLEKAKQQGDYLFILLESDATVEKLKGKGRPINNQKDRASMLAALSYVDYVVILSELKTNNDYDGLVEKINPNIIATTKNDPQAVHNKRQAKKINARVSYVVNRIRNKSTTKLARIISKNFNR